jgi:hypothetical protein
MAKNLVVLALIALFALPASALAGSCCDQSNSKPTQSQGAGSKDQTSPPAPTLAPGAPTSQANPAASPQPRGNAGQKPAASGPEKN